MDPNTQHVSDGIRVFGSAIIRVAPDIASIEVAVSRIEKKPTDAFAKAHADSKAVHDYLKSIGVDDIRSSWVHLSGRYEHRSRGSILIGYEARLAYSVVVRELDQVEALLVGVIDAGANELTSVSFQTSRLKEIREDARKRAVHAARRKAEVYADAADVIVGGVRAIEDVNPDILTRPYEGHAYRERVIDDPEEIEAADPGAIAIGAAVNVVFDIE